MAQDSPINNALRQFEATEANLAKLEKLWAEIWKLTPDGLCFGSDSKYEDLVRSYKDVLEALPKLDGWKPATVPADLNEIGQWRLDAKELGEIGAELSVEEGVEAPGRELAEYRHRLNKIRRRMIHNSMNELLASVDQTLIALERQIPGDAPTNQDITLPEWESLKEQIQAIETLLGSGLSRPPRWTDLRRHLRFGVVQDLRDIITLDWPEVKSGLTEGIYADDEPIPVDVEDLGILAAAQPTGPITVKLNWSALDDEGFERLIFTLMTLTHGYENPTWLTRTKAADRGRDLSVIRVINDPLSGVIRSRVIIQCKHWQSKSVAPADVVLVKEQMAMWEPPRVDVLVIATSGRFTSDAIDLIEKHNQSDRALRIEMWPESHLEKLLAERPALIGQFQLR